MEPKHVKIKIQVYETKAQCLSFTSFRAYLFLFILQGLEGKIKAFASRKTRNSVKKLRKDQQARKNLTFQTNKIIPDEDDGLDNVFSSEDDSVRDDSKVSPIDNLASPDSMPIPSRGTVLQACTVTSGLIAALGIIIRQVGFPFMHF